MSIINKFFLFLLLLFVIININGIKRTYYDCKKTISPHIENWCYYKGCGQSEIYFECFIISVLTLIIKITKQQHLPSTEIIYKIHILSTSSSSSSSLSMLLFIFTSSSNDYLFNVIR